MFVSVLVFSSDLVFQSVSSFNMSARSEIMNNVSADLPGAPGYTHLPFVCSYICLTNTESNSRAEHLPSKQTDSAFAMTGYVFVYAASKRSKIFNFKQL